MIDWSDNAVRATVFVVVLNIGLLAAHAVKDANQDELVVENSPSAEITETDFQSDIAELFKTGPAITSEDPNCFDVEELRWLTEGRDELSETLMTQSDLKPCIGTGTNHLAVDTVSDLIQVTGVGLSFGNEGDELSLSCMRRQIETFTGLGLSNPSANENFQNRDRQVQIAKLMCAARSSSGKSRMFAE